MQRFVLSVLSTVLAFNAVAISSAQALPKGDPTFSLHTLRLRDFDTRNKSEDAQPYYPAAQTPAPAAEWSDSQAEENTVESVKLTPQEWETSVEQGPSITERRQEVLDRS